MVVCRDVMCICVCLRPSLTAHSVPPSLRVHVSLPMPLVATKAFPWHPTQHITSAHFAVSFVQMRSLTSSRPPSAPPSFKSISVHLSPSLPRHLFVSFSAPTKPPAPNTTHHQRSLCRLVSPDEVPDILQGLPHFGPLVFGVRGRQGAATRLSLHHSAPINNLGVGVGGRGGGRGQGVGGRGVFRGHAQGSGFRG